MAAGVCVNVVASTAPAESENEPEIAAGVPEQVPLLKKSKVTVPVAVPALPPTVALSWTVVPSGTDVTTEWDGSWIWVVVLEALLGFMRTAAIAHGSLEDSVHDIVAELAPALLLPAPPTVSRPAVP